MHSKAKGGRSNEGAAPARRGSGPAMHTEASIEKPPALGEQRGRYAPWSRSPNPENPDACSRQSERLLLKPVLPARISDMWLMGKLTLARGALRDPKRESAVCIRCWFCAEPRAPRSVPPLVKGGEGGLVAGWHGPEAKKSPPTPPFEKGGEEGAKSSGFSRLASANT